MDTTAVYVFSDEQCMALGFTLMFRYFKTAEEAESYAAGFKFAQVVLL